MGCRFRFCFHKVCMVGSVYLPVLAAADFTDRKLWTGGSAASMLASIAAFSTYTIFPFVCFFRHDWHVTAVIRTGMGSCCLSPDDFAGMVVGINRAVGLLTNFADSRSGTGSCSAGTICFIKVSIAAIRTLMAATTYLIYYLYEPTEEIKYLSEKSNIA